MQRKSTYMDASENRKSVSESDSSADKPQRTAKEELQILWRDLVQKQRIHEMIKCLQAEKKKLKILHSNANDTDEFLEFAAQQTAEQVTNNKKPSLDRKSQTTSEGSRGAEMDAESHDKEEQLHQRHSSAQNIRQTSPSRTFKSKRAEEMAAGKNTITDQEFEDIIELCEDKIEQKALRIAYEEKKSRDLYLHNAEEKRVMLYNFINSKFFTNFMLITIIISIIGIFLLTFESISIQYTWPLIILDSCIIGIFIVEAVLKIIIYKNDYFKQLWNILDIVIIVVHLIEVGADLITRTLALSTDINAYITFKFLKSLRALRLLRVIKFLPNLQVIVATVFQSMLSIGSIAVLMLLFIFVFAVMGRGLFYERTPKNFGNLWLSFVTLFQLLTLDDWFELLESEDATGDIEEYESNQDENDNIGYWLMFGYLFAYLVIEFFVFLNLFVAVLVDNFQLTLADAEIQKQRAAQEELEAMRKFEDMKREGMDASITEEDHLRQRRELEQLGMFVDDYFPVDKDSKEAELLADFFKSLNSLDFQRFLWKRRQTLFNMITDTALASRLINAFVQESSSEDEEEDVEGTKDKEKKPSPKSDELNKDENEAIKAYLPSRTSMTKEESRKVLIL